MLQIDHQLNKLKGKNFHLKIPKHYIKFTKSSKMLTSMLHIIKIREKSFTESQISLFLCYYKSNSPLGIKFPLI